MPCDSPRIFVTCAELSGDQHAAVLVRALLRLCPAVRVEGVGGAALRGAGAVVHHETVRRARMGLGAFLRAGEIAGVLRWTRRHFRESGPPDLLVCCDSWTMNKHFLSLARYFGVPTLYFVSPQVWASREGRVRRMRQLVDRVAAILPFEEAWLRERGVNATFVGHPLFDELPPAPPGRERDGPPTVALIPGSRAKVARDNLPDLLAVADHVRAAVAGARFVVPGVEATNGLIERHLGASRGAWLRDGTVRIERDRFTESVGTADAAVCVSGTATLHAAALGVPLVAVYRTNWLAWQAIGRPLINTRTFALVNWLHPTRQHVVPEYVPWFGDAAPVAAHVIRWLTDPAARAAQVAAQSAVVDPLRQKGAWENAARIALEMIGAPRG